MSAADSAPNPRVLGALLIAVSIAVGIWAGWLISLAPWGVLAACLLTLATVGMGVGVLWTLRPSWSEKAWPPTRPEIPAADRARRSLRNSGVILLAPLPLAVGGLAWAIADGSLGWQRVPVLAFFVLTYGTAGVWFLRASRLHADAAEHQDSHVKRPADKARPRDPAEWRALGGPLKGTLPAAAFAPLVVALAVLPAQVLLILDDLPWGMMTWFAVVAIGAAVGLVALRRYWTPVEANPSSQLVRLGGKTLAWADVTRAELFVDPPWTGAPRTLILSLGDGSNRRGRVVLRRKGNLELSEEETELALRIVDASTIELPRDKDDPRGRFSRQLYPNSVTKTEASALIAQPPGMNDDLPISMPS